jgi:hypothetical protein
VNNNSVITNNDVGVKENIKRKRNKHQDIDWVESSPSKVVNKMNDKIYNKEKINKNKSITQTQDSNRSE